MIEGHELGKAAGPGEQIGIEGGGAGMILGRAGPLDALFLHAVVADAAVDRHKAGDLIHDLGWMVVGHRITHQGRDLADDLPFGQAGDRLDRLADPLDPAFAVGEGTVLFGKAGTGQDDMGKFGGLGMEEILNNQKFNRRKSLADMVGIGIGMSRILAEDKDPLEIALRAFVEHLHRFETRLVLDLHAPGLFELFAAWPDWSPTDSRAGSPARVRDRRHPGRCSGRAGP